MVSQRAIIEDESITTSPIYLNQKGVNQKIVRFLRKKVEEINEQRAQEELPVLEYSDEDNDSEEGAEKEFDWAQEKQSVALNKRIELQNARAKLILELKRAIENGCLSAIQGAIANGVDSTIVLDDQGNTLLLYAINQKD